MEVKLNPQLAVEPESPTSKPESRGFRIIQYLTKTVSGSSPKQPNRSQSLHGTISNGEAMQSTPSDSEESDDESHAHVTQSSSPATTRRSLLQKLSNGFIKESSHNEEDKSHDQNEGTYTWGMSRSVLEVSKGVAADLKGSFGRLLEMKSMLIEKLAAMPTIPADSLEHARHSIESIISDVTQSAYGKTKDAMVHIRLKLVEILPSLSPHETKKIVDDVEREVNGMSKATSADGGQPEDVKDGGKDGRVGVSDGGKDGRLGVSASTVSADIPSQPTSGLVGSVDRLKAWALLRSRL